MKYHPLVSSEAGSHLIFDLLVDHASCRRVRVLSLHGQKQTECNYTQNRSAK